MKTTVVRFKHIIIDADNPNDPHCKGAGDLDGNGFNDLVVASASGGGLYWYRYPDWSKHKIADGGFTTDMAVADLDGDGFDDIVIPSYQALIWYRSPAASGGDPTRDDWQVQEISPVGAHMHDVRIADMDGDANMELVTRHQSGFGSLMGNQIYIWKRDHHGNWLHCTFSCPHGEGLAVADLTGNGLPDVIIGGRWYENSGELLRDEWLEHCYISDEHFASGWTKGDVCVAAGDLDGDGRKEIVLSPSEGRGRLAWFKAPANLRQDEWEEHILDASLDHAHALALGDMSENGAMDIVVAKMHQASTPQEIAIYYNTGSGKTWQKQVIATSGSHNLQLVRVGSSRLSIFGANWNDQSLTGGAVELYLNEGCDDGY